MDFTKKYRLYLQMMGPDCDPLNYGLHSFDSFEKYYTYAENKIHGSIGYEPFDKEQVKFTKWYDFANQNVAFIPEKIKNDDWEFYPVCVKSMGDTIFAWLEDEDKDKHEY
jgi:hypothetical protein